jgi:glucoamylase
MKSMIRNVFFFTGCLALAPAFALNVHADTQDLQFEAERSLNRLSSNLDHSGIRPGAVIASPSRGTPDYFYHWIRDAALVMDVYVETFVNGTDPVERQDAYVRVMRWMDFERVVQSTPNLSGSLGEPKYNVDASSFDKPWGRPQNDGPALRGFVLARFAEKLLDEGRDDLVRQLLYRAELPANSLVKADLEFVAHNWRQPSFDLWEEVKGRHLYTRLAQRAALERGARLAQRMDDGGAAAFYRSQAAEISKQLADHRDPGQGYLRVTLDRVDGWDHKKSGLDVATVLGVLHAAGEGADFDVDDEWVLATAEKLRRGFQASYPINSGATTALIGRYPEDVYDGVGFSGGHPWYLATHALAELHCRLADKIRSQGRASATSLSAAFYSRALGKTVAPGTKWNATNAGAIDELLSSLERQGRAYLERSLSVSGSKGFAEQVDRDTGAPRGASDLSWSYASYVSAFRACAR